MPTYHYTQPLEIEITPKTTVYKEDGKEICTFQRYYSNKLKWFLDRAMEYRYFLRYDIYDLNDQVIFTCKKVSKKGRVFFQAFDYETKEHFTITYDKWKELVADLLILGKDLNIVIEKELEDWTSYVWEGREIARWRARVEGEFLIELEIHEESPIQNPAFFVAISQCALYIGS